MEKIRRSDGSAQGIDADGLGGKRNQGEVCSREVRKVRAAEMIFSMDSGS
jgi:hypothetical protein